MIMNHVSLSLNYFLSPLKTEILEIQPKTNSYDGEKRYRQQLEPLKKSSYTYEYNTMAVDFNHPHHMPPSHHHAVYPTKRSLPLNANIHENNIYHEPQVAITYSVPFDKISSKVSNSNTSSTRKLQSDTISSSTESCKCCPSMQFLSTPYFFFGKHSKISKCENG